jgi:tRNA threonylcarbamoyladenosine biosynthesis protein TsaB
VAQGLGFGAAVPLLPVDTLMAVAQDAWTQLGSPEGLRVTALLDARMDEMYTASYSFGSDKVLCSKHYSLISPENLVWNGPDVLAGNVFAAYSARINAVGAQWVQAMPTAAALLQLAPALLALGAGVSADQALPTYIRDKVAQTTQERADAKLAALVT